MERLLKVNMRYQYQDNVIRFQEEPKTLKYRKLKKIEIMWH